MPDSDIKKRLTEEVGKIDSQMVALAKLKKRHLALLSSLESPEKRMSSEERREALADALAEGIAYLGERGLLPLTDDPEKTLILPGSSKPHKTKTPNEKRPKDDK
jgi:hypothetical protein